LGQEDAQALVVNDLDDVADAPLLELGGLRPRERTIAEKDGAVVGFDAAAVSLLWSIVGYHRIFAYSCAASLMVKGRTLTVQVSFNLRHETSVKSERGEQRGHTRHGNRRSIRIGGHVDRMTDGSHLGRWTTDQGGS
jgi:hypothetical protein